MEPIRAAVMTRSHFATGWQDQRGRVGRWHKRLSAIGRGIPVGMNKEEALDDVFAFFMNCYHLRDWVIGSGFKSEADVDGYIRGNNDLALCRDICTGLKHFRVEHKRALFDSSWSKATVTVASFPERREPIPGEYWVSQRTVATSTCSILPIDASLRGIAF